MGFTFSRKQWLRNSSMAAVAAAIGLLAAPMAQAEAGRFQFDIPAENTAKALNDFARQSGIQLLFPYDAAVAFSSPALKGSLTREEALERLLANTNLEVASTTATTITLRVVVKNGDAVSQAESVVEVIVTGTHIRGGNPTSPIHTVTRKDIDQSGYSQVGDVMRSLPENFSGGQNPGVIGASSRDANNHNLSGASTVNLRGLGTDATLVLVNGHRLSSDTLYQASDISGVPLGAVQRVEIVPDGASALYGSDAVAGVVNFVLRKDYDGTEVSARIGGASQGGGAEHTYSFLTGRRGADWYTLSSLEYSEQDEIRASQRDFTSGVTPVTSLMPSQTRKSFFLSAGRDLNDTVAVAIDALISDRSSTYANQFSPAAPFQLYSASTPGYSVAAHADLKLSGDWNLKVSAVASGSRNSLKYEYPAYGISGGGIYRNKIQYLEITADGTLLHLPTGDVKAAAGGGYRHENFQQGNAGSSTYVAGERNVSYLYGEALIPLIRSSPDRTGLHELALNLSARIETYSDFGTNTNPKIGVRYVPFTDLTVRGTWGQSFKAPTFFQMYQPAYLYLLDASSMGYAGAGTALLTQGGNPDLKPEKSKSWTIGADYSPSAFRSMKVSATYFNIDYKDRVVMPVGVVATGLSDPVYAPFVETSPSSVRQAELIDSASQFDNYSSGAYDPAQVVAVLLDAYTNATAQSVRGLDLSYRQSFVLPVGTLDGFANATFIHLDQQTISTAPEVELSGTIASVPDLKLRGGLSWRAGGFSATGIVNYVSGEADTGTLARNHIASWTTADLNLAYEFSQTQGLSRGLKVALAVSNLFDRNPPYAQSPSQSYPGIYFDSTNSSAVGRFVSLNLRKSW